MHFHILLLKFSSDVLQFYLQEQEFHKRKYFTQETLVQEQNTDLKRLTSIFK